MCPSHAPSTCSLISSACGQRVAQWWVGCNRQRHIGMGGDRDQGRAAAGPGACRQHRPTHPLRPIHAQPGSAATDAVGILPGFTGVSLHDGWAGYHAYTTCRYALCNVHHMRELTFLEEEFHQAWAKDLKELLQEMRTAADQAHTQGQQRLAATQRDILLTRYCDLLAAGLAANTPPFFAGANEPPRKAIDQSRWPCRSRTARAARQMRSHTPSSPQRLSRRHTVVGAPYSRGRSCQRQPVMSTYRLP